MEPRTKSRDSKVVASAELVLKGSGRRRGLKQILPFMGPAFIASIAYIDPGNFATNIQGGAEFGYVLLWVVVASNLMAMLLQTLSAKLGIATGTNLAEHCRNQFPRPVVWMMWGVMEVVSMATKVCGASLHLVVVVPTLRTLSGVGAASGLLLPATTMNILQLAHSDAADYLARQIALLRGEGLRVVGEVLRGEPGEIIVKTARQVTPSVIVLGIHNEEGLAAFLSQTAISKVACSTPLPLLLVREWKGI